ncbi:MAG: DUF4031 domain-containing protein [Blastocatellia bacterium]
MAILIDSFYNGSRGPIRYWYRRCGHLVSDHSVEELHDFAARLGLRREWFQAKSIPHYDLTGGAYDLALELGAVLVSSRDIVRRAVRIEAEFELLFVEVRKKCMRTEQTEITEQNQKGSVCSVISVCSVLSSFVNLMPLA